MTQDNPYAALLGIFRQDAADQSPGWPWRFGIIRSLSPLMVDIAGKTVTDGLWINPLLMGRGGTSNLSGLAGSLQSPGGNTTVTGGDLSGDISLSGVLAVGDRVVLLQAKDGQEFIILSKVVGT